jgi:formate-dependent nitrite reductase cytochrome c552 subunit
MGGTEKCVTCHMPKYEVQDMHYKFTEHMIRVVKTGAPFPD